MAFTRLVPALHAQFEKDAHTASSHAQLQSLTPHVIGTTVHVRFDFDTADAAGQNMVSAATQRCCDDFMLSDWAKEMQLQKIFLEGQMTSGLLAHPHR